MTNEILKQCYFCKAEIRNDPVLHFCQKPICKSCCEQSTNLKEVQDKIENILDQIKK